MTKNSIMSDKVAWGYGQGLWEGEINGTPGGCAVRTETQSGGNGNGYGRDFNLVASRSDLAGKGGGHGFGTKIETTGWGCRK